MEHAPAKVITSRLILSLATLDLVHKLLQLVPKRHLILLTVETSRFSTRLFKDVGFLRPALHPLLNHTAAIFAADIKYLLDIDPMLEDDVDEAAQRHLASCQLYLEGRERLVRNHDLLVCDRYVERVPYNGALQRIKGLVNSAVREAELGFKFVITVVVNLSSVKFLTSQFKHSSSSASKMRRSACHGQEHSGNVAKPTRA